MAEEITSQWTLSTDRTEVEMNWPQSKMVLSAKAIEELIYSSPFSVRT